MQERVVEVSGDDSVLVGQEEVRRTGLGDIIAAREEHLVGNVVTFGVECGAERHYIVGSALHRTELRCRPRRLGLDVNGERTNATGEVVTDWRVDDVEQTIDARCRGGTDVGCGSDHRGANVERTGRVGCERCVRGCGIDHELTKKIRARRNHAQFLDAQQHALNRIFETEDGHRAVDLAMRLQPFETLARIVEHVGCWMEREILQRLRP